MQLIFVVLAAVAASLSSVNAIPASIINNFEAPPFADSSFSMSMSSMSASASRSASASVSASALPSIAAQVPAPSGSMSASASASASLSASNPPFLRFIPARTRI